MIREPKITYDEAVQMVRETFNIKRSASEQEQILAIASAACRGDFYRLIYDPDIDLTHEDFARRLASVKALFIHVMG